MKLYKYSMIFALVAVLISVVGCSKKAEEKSDPINIEVRRVEPYRSKATFAYSGTIEASETIPLSFNVNGTILQVAVSEGDYVKKGELLATLNETTLRNVYEMSQAALERAEDAYKRLKPMYENGNLPEIKFVEVETGLQQGSGRCWIEN